MLPTLQAHCSVLWSGLRISRAEKTLRWQGWRELGDSLEILEWVE